MQIVEIEEPRNKSEEEQIVIGIDFGTTNSLSSYAQNGKYHLFLQKNNDYLLPSALSIIPTEDGIEINVGAKGPEENSKYISSIKRFIGKNLEEVTKNKALSISGLNFCAESKYLAVNLSSKKYSIPFLASHIFAELKTAAENHLNRKIKQAVVTVPAYFDDFARGQVMYAAKLAGLDVIRLIAEPTAAAYAYGLDKKTVGTYLIYDLGGGTFDVSILNMESGVFQVVATGGDLLLGGDDIDMIIARHLAVKLKRPIDQELILYAKKIKEEIDTQKYDAVINNSEFEELINPFIQKTIDIAEDVLEEAKQLMVPELDGIILVGGSTKLSMIPRILKEKFAVPIIKELNPDTIVAAGAAFQAAALSVNQGNEAVLIDVLPLSVGIVLYGGIVEKIILRNTPLPYSATKTFTTYADNQTGMSFHIVQGEREMAEDCISLAHFELKDIPPMKAGIAKIEVTFSMDVNGMLSVTAMETTTSVAQNCDIRYTHSLSPEMIERELEIAFTNAQLDHERRTILQTKLEAQNLIDGMKKALEETPDIINEVELTYLKEKIKALQNSIIVDNRESIIDKMTELNEIARRFIEQHINFGASKILVGKNINSIK